MIAIVLRVERVVWLLARRPGARASVRRVGSTTELVSVILSTNDSGST